MGIGLWGLSPLCEIGISRRSVYQMTTSREQARGEGNCGRANVLRRLAIRHGRSCKGPWQHGQDYRKWCRDDERLVSFARCLESENPLGRTCSSSWNRLVRTRMLGGVGRVPGNGHPYPILLFLGFHDKPIREIWHVVPVYKFIPFCFAFGKVPYL